MSYSAWRISYQDGEQAARAAWRRMNDLEAAFERLYRQRNNGRLADHLESEYRHLFREDEGDSGNE